MPEKKEKKVDYERRDGEDYNAYLDRVTEEFKVKIKSDLDRIFNPIIYGSLAIGIILIVISTLGVFS